MKKLLVLAAALVCALSPLFAGGGKAPSSGKTTIRLGIWPIDTEVQQIALHESHLKEFKQRYPDYDAIPASMEYAVDTFVPLAESGRLPTVFTTWFTEPPKLINGGFVRDITAELRALGWDSKMNPAVRELLSKDGKIYGFPRDSYALGLYLNVDLFRKAGLMNADGTPRYPKTWDELAQTAVTIKQRTGSAGLCLLAKDNAGGWHFTQIAWGFGAKFVVEQGGRRVAQVNSPEVVAAMQFVKDLKWRYDVLTSDPTSEDWGTGFRAIGTGAAAMYIAANDAVNQPTRNNGLPVGDLALVPVPAGPAGQFSLMGGTPYMFASNATSAEVTAAIRYIEILGSAPVVNDTTLRGMRAGAQVNKNDGVPVIRGFPVWTDEAYVKAQTDAANEFKNVDDRFYADYFAAVAKPGNLRTEEPNAQDLYSELTKVLQAVITDRNANVQALLDTAQRNFQRLLDQ